jgi:hypothetical protein
LKPCLIITISIFAVSLSGRAAELSLESCAAIEDPAERFACYDTLAGRSPADTAKTSDTVPGGVDPAESGADVIALAAPVVTQTAPAAEPTPDEEAIFGLKNKQRENRPDKLQLKWTRKKKDTFGKWIIFMENGQVWHQTDTRRISFRNSEQLVVISRSFGGGFFLAEPDNRVRIRVKRVK